jgi:CubicO group peptidase (beta-lactamase class C family)
MLKRNKIGWIFQKTFLLLLYGLVVINLLVLLSGRTYLYDGLVNVYLKGKSGPDVYDINDGNSVRVTKASHEAHAVTSSKEVLSNSDLSFFKKYDTESFLVYKSDTLCYEWYENSFSQHKPSNSFSMAKSLVSLLIGIAIQEKKIKSLDEPVKNYIPKFAAYGRSTITIRNLLTMSSGLDWQESAANPFSENAEAYYSSDVNRIVLNQRLNHKPGKVFTYQSGNTQLLAIIVQKATGCSLSDYANDKIWRHLKPEDDVFWGADKSYQEKAFCCLYASPIDYLKLGRLILNEGVYDGKQIVPKSYLQQAFTPIPMLTKYLTPNRRYGLHFWVYQDKSVSINYFHGLQGQYILVFPKEKLIIVRTGHKRSEEYGVGDFFKNANRLDLNTNYTRIGHPTDLFRYIHIARKSIKLSHEVK